MKKHKENDTDGVFDIAFEPDDSGASEEIDIAEEENITARKIEKVAKELKQCRAQKQEYLDGWQRAKADYVNALRRFEEEKAAIQGRNTAHIIKTLLPALDSLERARGAGEIPTGFDAIAKQLAGAFTALGVSEVPVEIGEAFDPARHEAMGQDTTDDTSRENTISAVLERGWQVGTAVIRPAKVRVAHHA